MRLPPCTSATINKRTGTPASNSTSLTYTSSWLPEKCAANTRAQPMFKHCKPLTVVNTSSELTTTVRAFGETVLHEDVGGESVGKSGGKNNDACHDESAGFLVREVELNVLHRG